VPVASETAEPVDLHVGAAIRRRRKSLGISQVALAGKLGLTFQQVQKYERGGNRVSASKLDAIARALNCLPGDFFPAHDEPDAVTKSWLDAARSLNIRRPGLAERLCALPDDVLGAFATMADNMAAAA